MASLGFEYLRRTYQPTVSITWQSGDSSHSSNDLPSTPAIPPKSTRYPKQKLEKFTASRLAETEDPVTEDCSRDVRDPDVSPDSNSKKSNPPPPSANEDPADETESHDSDMNREGCDTATGAVLVRKQDPRLVGVGRCNFGVYEYEERY
ncbi:hypothetical protein MPER_06756 [Moniliophthora perniciosa FA553]|nr:hypothetical protein MPER_06756 [Moniliophthora perniciosa FA553]